MKNGKYTKRRGVATKVLVMTLALMLVVGLSVGGTLAWLTAKTNSVVNTFTVGDINIDLTETERTYKIIPGVDLAKDPKVTVKKDSEACWLFVKVVEANWPKATEADGTRKVNYAIAAGWNLVDGTTDVYYREVAASTADQVFDVLANNQVTVSKTLTKTEANAITVAPTLTFTAYAIQKDGFATAAAAWAEASK